VPGYFQSRLTALKDWFDTLEACHPERSATNKLSSQRPMGAESKDPEGAWASHAATRHFNMTGGGLTSGPAQRVLRGGLSNCFSRAIAFQTSSKVSQ
jgi:hypothetical protein